MNVKAQGPSGTTGLGGATTEARENGGGSRRSELSGGGCGEVKHQIACALNITYKSLHMI